ncbi:MAG: hypothetical protein HC888_07465, partial [Candidatus Competibacteraceae bacterium]|nr:hypothetical protein [Candidatus Competibacteraceae bacterium]
MPSETSSLRQLSALGSDLAALTAIRLRTPKTFSQADLDRIVQERVGKLNEKNRTLLEQMEQLQTTFKGSDEQRQALEGQLEELRQRTLSQTEIEKREAEKARRKYEADLKTAQDTGAQWESRFRGLQFDTEVQAAALKHGVMPTSIPLLSAFLRT